MSLGLTELVNDRLVLIVDLVATTVRSIFRLKSDPQTCESRES